MTECSGGGWATNAALNFIWDVQNLLALPMRKLGEGFLLLECCLTGGRQSTLWRLLTCRGMITINSDGKFALREDYYAWAHFSRFVDPGATVIGSTDLSASSISDVAFRNPDGSIVVVAANTGLALSTTPATTVQVRSGSKSFNYALPSLSAATFTWWRQVRRRLRCG